MTAIHNLVPNSLERNEFTPDECALRVADEAGARSLGRDGDGVVLDIVESITLKKTFKIYEKTQYKETLKSNRFNYPFSHLRAFVDFLELLQTILGKIILLNLWCIIHPIITQI